MARFSLVCWCVFAPCTLVLPALPATAYTVQKLSQHGIPLKQGNGSSIAVLSAVLKPEEVDDNTSDPQETTGSRRLETLENKMMAGGGSLTVSPIGTVRSIYKLCVGTPRQGLLAPHARGRIELDGLREAKTCVEGLQEFSHVWIVFVFHLNTVGKSQVSRISPPALGGDRVGVLATRSPHRINPIGMTLAKLDGVRTVRRFVEGRKRPLMCTYLELSGIDLVDGTPVLDIKPYVSDYDAPPFNAQTGGNLYQSPSWVSQGLALQRLVDITPGAHENLRSILVENPRALEFYGRGPDDSIDQTIADVTACIREVLAMDVRSQFQTEKVREGRSKAERSQRLRKLRPNPTTSENETDSEPGHMLQSESTQQIDNLLIRFRTVESATFNRNEVSAKSGAEDTVIVTCIELVQQSTSR